MYVNDEYKKMVAEKVEKIKTKVWLSIVLYYSEAKNPNNLDKRIYELEHGNTKDYISQSRIWYRYEKAEDIPRLNTIERINKILPDTSYYFNHPFWVNLNYNSYSFLDITQMIAQLNQEIACKLIYLEDIGDQVLRRFPTTQKLLKEIENCNPFDVLMVSFLLYSEAIDQDQPKKDYILNFIEKHVQKMKSIPELQFTQDIVFDFIINFARSLALKNAINCIHKEDIEIYKKISEFSQIGISRQNAYITITAFNKIRDLYE